MTGQPIAKLMEYFLSMVSAMNRRRERLKISFRTIPTAAWWLTIRTATIILLFGAEREDWKHQVLLARAHGITEGWIQSYVDRVPRTSGVDS